MIVEPRKLLSYAAVYRLAARPYALSNVFAGVGRKQFATIHHAASAVKTVKIRHIWVALESASAAAIVMADVVRITTAPVTGNPAITPVKVRGLPGTASDEDAEATCLALPTTGGTEDANPFATQEWNLGITGAGGVQNPPQGLIWNDMVNLASSDAGDHERKHLIIRPGVLEGWALTMDAGAAATVKGYVTIEFNEELGQAGV